VGARLFCGALSGEPRGWASTIRQTAALYRGFHSLRGGRRHRHNWGGGPMHAPEGFVIRCPPATAVFAYFLGISAVEHSTVKRLRCSDPARANPYSGGPAACAASGRISRKPGPASLWLPTKISKQPTFKGSCGRRKDAFGQHLDTHRANQRHSFIIVTQSSNPVAAIFCEEPCATVA